MYDVFVKYVIPVLVLAGIIYVNTRKYDGLCDCGTMPEGKCRICNAFDQSSP